MPIIAHKLTSSSSMLSLPIIFVLIDSCLFNLQRDILDDMVEFSISFMSINSFLKLDLNEFDALVLFFRLYKLSLFTLKFKTKFEFI